VLAIPPTDSLPDEFVRHLMDRLQACGDLRVDVISDTCAGERDVRLAISRDHRAVTVELLCDQDRQTPLSHWHAARVVEGTRCVWRGPRRDCNPDRVLTFIDNLLSAQPTSLSEQYLPLG
jgi:hypothetical protein